MAMPATFGYAETLVGMTDRLVGPPLAAASFLALWPTLRFLRWVEPVAASWIFITPFFVRYDFHGNTLPGIAHVWVAVLLFGIASLGGKTPRSYGGGWASVLPLFKRETRKEL